MLRSLYRRAFVERIQALATRMDMVTRELTALRAEVEALRSEVGAVRAAQDSLERQVETVIAGGWDTTAIARRLAAVEDRLERE